jgi:ribA/ribD-fused uncharacterized protein
MTVYFYRVNDAFGELSNFSKHGFQLEGKHWPTSEHYFQAQKMTSLEYQEQIRKCESVRDAARLGRTLPMRPDWGDVRVEVMRKALRAKFNAHEDLRRILLSTGDEEIVEETTDDYFWGCGTQGDGENMLGQLLMELRQEIRNNESPTD